MKRSKNIFNTPIAGDNLIDPDGHQQYRVGNISIESDWLKRINPKQYRKYIMSAFQLSVLQRQLLNLNQTDSKGHLKQSNIFRIGLLKKKIANFQLVQEAKQENIIKKQQSNNEPPPTQSLVIQKIAGFFKSSILRKCKIQEKQLFVQSQKDVKSPWINIQISKYTIQLQYKQKPLQKSNFKQYNWIENYKARILLEGNKLYCLYGEEELLKKFQRYFQVENITVKQLAIFKELNKQYKQKIVTYFGDRVRFLQHNAKVRRFQKQSIKKGMTIEQKYRPTEIQPIYQFNENKVKDNSNQLQEKSENASSNLLQSRTNPQKKDEFLSSDIHIKQNYQTPLKNKINTIKSTKPSGSDVFKLKVKSSVMFYDQIQQPLQFNNKISSPAFTVNDIKLDLKQQGMSDVEQQMQSHYSLTQKNSSKKRHVQHLIVQNSGDQKDKYNINIFQIQSQSSSDLSSQKIYQSNNFHRNSTSSLGYLIKNSDILEKNDLLQPIPFVDRQRRDSQMDSVMQYFREHQDNFQSDSDLQSVGSKISKKRQTFLIKNFNFKNSTMIKKIKKKDQIQIVEQLQKQQMHYNLKKIVFLIPYNLPKIKIKLLQIHPDLQMQNKIVICSKAQVQLNSQINQKQKYTSYSIEGGFPFTFTKKNDRFVFVLEQQTRFIYIPFQMNPSPKHQRNCSQLLIKKLQEGFTIACVLQLFASPMPVILRQELTTIEFMTKYLTQGQNFDFKHDFIENKKKKHMINKQWNKKVIQTSIKQGNLQQFSKSVFLGMSQSVFKKMKKNVKYDSSNLFSFTDNQIKMMQQNIISSGILDLRVFMKPSNLIRYVSEGHFNTQMKQRIEQVYVYFLNRFGSTRNLALVLIKQILNKVQPIILLGRRQQQVYSILNLYFEIQYEIDQLFIQIRKYFK